ncbi:MAG: rRNA pseudouridine synthase [Burkholderiales bacterium]|nr:rRNA pseudouridine synthase [Burkholderiales bacterium]
MRRKAGAKPQSKPGSARPRHGPLRPPVSAAARKPGKPPRPTQTPVATPATGEIRGEKLHKVLAQAGFGSRRAMEERIRAGEVTVNGKVAGIGDRVTAEDRVKVGDRMLRWPQPDRLPRVLLYHKPEGEIVSNDDPQGRPTVFAKLPPAKGAKWLAIGRLDFNTSGLLIFTTSGDLANRMMHPRFAVDREYAVRVLGTVHPAALDALRAGVRLEDGVARFEQLEEEGGEGANRWFRVLLKEGRNRIVRRLFESQNLTVSRLMRVRFGIVALPPRLKRGQFIELPAADVAGLQAWLENPAQAEAAAPPVAAAARSRPRRSSPPR